MVPTKRLSRVSSFHNYALTGTGNKRVTNFKSANGMGRVMWFRESEEAGFAEVAGPVEKVGQGVRVSDQQTRNKLS